MLDQYWCGSKPDWKALKVTLSNLEDYRDKKHELYKRCKLTASESFRIRKIAEEMIKRDDVTTPSHQATRKRKHDIER